MLKKHKLTLKDRFHIAMLKRTYRKAWKAGYFTDEEYRLLSDRKNLEDFLRMIKGY